MITSPQQLPPGVPFSLACSVCDCDSPDTLEVALAEGWTEIQFDPEGFSWNFLGFCPDHSENEDPDSATGSSEVALTEIPPWEAPINPPQA